VYEYRLKSVVAVYDGDTFTAEVDIGFNIVITEKFRLNGEFKAEGKLARDFLRKMMDTESDIIIRTKKDKDGRYLAEIFIDGEQLSYMVDNE
jgi:micrococcal nuclease